MPRAPVGSDWLMLAALTLLWGTSFMLNEVALRAFTPLELVASRTLIAAIVLTLYMAATGNRLPNSFREWLPMAVMATLGTVVPFQLLAWAQLTIDSSVTGILTAIVPLFVLTLSHFFIPGVRLTANRLGGFVIGFVGVAVVIGPSALSAAQEFDALVAMLAVLVAAVSYSVNTVYARLRGLRNPAVLSAGMMVLATAFTMPRAASGLLDWPAAPSILPYFALAALGLLSTGLATVLYFRLVQGPGPAFLSLINYLVPACAVVVGALVLGESPSGWVYGGLCLILAGIAWSEFGPSKLWSLAGRAVKKVAAA